MSVVTPRTPEQAANGVSADDVASQVNSSTAGADTSAQRSEPKPTAMTDAQATEEMRRVYDNLSRGEPAGKAKQEETSGQGNPDNGVSEPAKAKGDGSDPSGAADQKQTDSNAEPERLAKARMALKRWQWPDDLLEQLPESVILDRGEAAAESQASFDRQITEKQRLQRTVEEILADRERQQRQSEGNQQGTSTPAQGKNNQSDDGSASLVDSLLSDAGELVNDEEMGPVIKSFANALKGFEQRISTLNLQNESLRTQMQGRQDAMQIEGARRELTVEYPALADRENSQRVEALVYKLSELPGYLDSNGNPDVNRLYRDAAQTILGKPVPKNNGAARVNQNYQKQVDGQPDGHLGNGQVIQGMTPNDKLMAAYRMTFKEGKDPDAVRQALRRTEPS